MIKEKFQAVKDHVRENKAAYISGGVCLVVAGFTCHIMRGRYEALVTDGAYGPKTADTLVTMRSLSFLSPHQKNVVNVLSRDGRGHPGYLVHNLDTNEYFYSQRDAAATFDISETLLSKHLNGKIPDAEGYHFERLGFAT